VGGTVSEAVILLPGLPPEAACLRSSVEAVDWSFGAAALGAMREEMGRGAQDAELEGAQNWWAHFADTGQDQGYPLSIAGISRAKLQDAPLTCNKRGRFPEDCQCTEVEQLGSSAPSGSTSPWSMRRPPSQSRAPARTVCQAWAAVALFLAVGGWIA